MLRIVAVFKICCLSLLLPFVLFSLTISVPVWISFQTSFTIGAVSMAVVSKAPDIQEHLELLFIVSLVENERQK
jgi:hypothetical protein